MITASLASASMTSDSEMSPILAWRILTVTSSLASSFRLLTIGSSVPCISAHDQVQRLCFATLEAGEEVLQRHGAARSRGDRGSQAPFLGNLPCSAVVVDPLEDVTRHGHFLQSPTRRSACWGRPPL